jgi:hypothetical protein
MFALGISNFIFYFLFQGFKNLVAALKLYIKLRRAQGNLKVKTGGFSGQKNVEDLLTSMMAGVINVLLTNPLWVAVTLMKKQNNEVSVAAAAASSSSSSSLTATTTASDNDESENKTTGASGSAGLSSSSSSSCCSSGSGVHHAGRHEGITGMFQLMRDMAEKDGLQSLWKGCSASLVLVSNPIIHFAVYEGLKRMMLNRYTTQLQHISYKPSCNHKMSYHRHNIYIYIYIYIFLCIWNANVLSDMSLWILDMCASLCIMTCELGVCIYFYPSNHSVFTHIFCKHTYSNKSVEFTQVLASSRSTTTVSLRTSAGSVLTPAQGFIIGGVAKTVATVLTYPLQVAQVKLRGNGDTNGKTARQVIEELWESEGMAGLFQGLESKIIQSALTSALIFGSYEAILGFFMRFSPNRR